MENMTNNTWTVFENGNGFDKEEIEYLTNLMADNDYIEIPKLTFKMKVENRIKDMIQKTKKVFSKKNDPFIDGSFLDDLEELPFD